MARPTYTPPPAGGPPTVGDPDFAAKADAYLGWFPTHGTFSDNLATWMQTEFFAELADGTLALPSVRFINDPDSGFRRKGVNNVAGVAGGVDAFDFTSSSFKILGSEAYRRANVVGTVAQSGGVPTGALFERGSNANGDYLRFADGTQICWNSAFSLTYSSISALQSDWTYPAAFSAGPSVTAMPIISSLTYGGGIDGRVAKLVEI